METIGNKRGSTKWLCAWICSFVVLFASLGFASEDEPTPGELLKKSGQFMKLKKYEEAIESMYAYLDLTKPSTAPGVIKIAQDLRFKLIVVLIENTKDNRLEEAAELLREYINLPLGEHPRMARSLLATCLFEIGEMVSMDTLPNKIKDIKQYAECTVAAKNALLYNEDPTTRAGAAALTADEVERYAKFGMTNYELEYKAEDVTALHMAMAEAYYKLEKWEECIEPYTYVAEHTVTPQHKGYAIMQMINAMIAMPDFDRIAKWIPELYRTPARFDIRVNLALMNVAAALYDEGRFDEALPLYRMILRREELVAYQEEELRKLRVKNELPPDENMDVSEEEKKLFGLVDEEEDAAADVKPKAIVDLENLIKIVKGLPPYETNIKYRMAQIYDSVDRFWEAVKFLGMVYELEPQSKMGEFALHQQIKILLRKLDAFPEAKQCGFAYMEKQKTGLKVRHIAYLFTTYHQKKNEMAEIKELRPFLDEFVRAGDDTSVTNGTECFESIVKYDAELYFMQAVADLVLYNFADSEKGFKLVLDDFPGSHEEGNSLYWYGMSKLFLGKFGDAYAVFEDYGQMFPDEEWIDEASYQGGVCQFGLENYNVASNRFSHVISTYPNSSVFPEACSMRGDIHGSLGTIEAFEAAESDYRMALEHATKPAQSTYAVFKLAALLKGMDRYDDVITMVQAYLDQWNDKADIAKALFWIGKSKLQKRANIKDEQLADALLEEVVDDYLAAIVKYGIDVKQEGVDLMIDELDRVSNLWLDFDQQDVLLAKLKAEIEETDDLVLSLRLRATMAMITNTEAELGRKLLVELPDFEHVSPPVLAVICKVSIESKDYDRGEELLELFKTKFEDSDYVRVAYELRSLGQFAEEDYDGTRETLDDVQGRFGEDPEMAWAQLMMARVSLELGEFDTAISNNLSVIGVSAWRGVPVVQATYQLGQVEERAGLKGPAEKRDKRLGAAFGYYQRVYMQYKGYAGGYWAAEAYLASARCLDLLGQENDRRNTYRALLFDSFVNTLPQADVARKELGAVEVAGIEAKLAEGAITNITIEVEMEAPEAGQATTPEVAAEGDES